MFMKDISAVTRYWYAYTHQSLKEIHLAGSEHSVIMYLSQQESVNQDAISEHLALDKGTIARTLTKLEEKNLVTRVVNNNNRRENLVSLTPYGQSKVDAVMQVSENWDTQVMQGIDAAQQEMFITILSKITKNAKNLTHTVKDNTIHEY
nr:MarR family winged helix-turn-helix transcriptional regulator [uncultured Sphaerochaeta sp.]